MKTVVFSAFALLAAIPSFGAVQYTVQVPIQDLQPRSALTTDILWVIDDSGSMDPYQKALLAGVPEFARRLGAKATSWSMGVVTTDAKAGAKMQIELSRVTAADTLSEFVGAVQKLGVSGSATEQPFASLLAEAKRQPLTFSGVNDLAIVFVTDAPDQSAMTAADLLRELPIAAGKKISMYGLFGATDLGCMATNDSWTYKGSQFEALFASAASSQVAPICGASLDAALGDFADRIVAAAPAGARTEYRFSLGVEPAAGSLKVFFNGKELVSGPRNTGAAWSYDAFSNAVVFHHVAFASLPTDRVEIVFSK